MIQVGVKCVLQEPVTERTLMVLESEDGKIALPIPIGRFEAGALKETMKGNVITSRVYEFISDIVDRVPGVEPKYLVIDSLKDEVFTAKLVLDQGGSLRPVDCRPSDGVIIAMRMRVPVFVDKYETRYRQIEKGVVAGGTSGAEL